MLLDLVNPNSSVTNLERSCLCWGAAGRMAKGARPLSGRVEVMASEQASDDGGLAVKRTVAGVGVAAVLMAGAAAVPVSAQAAGGKYYSSCDALTAKYPNGVAKSKKVAKRAVRQGFAKPAAGKKARKVYWANDSDLDRDKDGIACEQTN